MITAVPSTYYFLNPSDVSDPEPSDLFLFSPPTRMIPYGDNAPELSMRPADWKPELHPADALAQLKVDGISAYYIAGQVYSLQGNRLTCADHCIPDFQALERAAGMELMIPTEFEAGTFRETLSAMRSCKPGRGRCWAYDVMPFAQWSENRCRLALFDRLVMLEKLLAETRLQSVGGLSSWAVDVTEVRHLLAQAKEQKLEGFVIKSAKSMFERRVSSEWLKLKVSDTVDGIVVSTDKRSLIVQYNDGVKDDETIRVSVGLPADVRALLADGADIDLLNRSLELEILREAITGHSRQARFVRWREDKDNG